MPEILITRPPSAWHLFFTKLAPLLAVIVVAAVVLGIAQHNSALIVGVLPVPLLMAGGFVGQAWTVRRDQARMSVKLLASSPPGTRYAALATPIAPTSLGTPAARVTKLGDQGTLRIEPPGISFEPKHSAVSGPERYQWAGLAQVVVTGRTPISGWLEIMTVDGVPRRWLTPSILELIDVLDQISSGASALPPPVPPLRPPPPLPPPVTAG